MGYSRRIITITKLRQKLISRNKKIHDENGIDKGNKTHVNMSIYPNLYNSFITKAGCADYTEVLGGNQKKLARLNEILKFLFAVQGS
jgi:hypothetical protein